MLLELEAQRGASVSLRTQSKENCGPGAQSGPIPTVLSSNEAWEDGAMRLETPTFFLLRIMHY